MALFCSFIYHSLHRPWRFSPIDYTLSTRERVVMSFNSVFVASCFRRPAGLQRLSLLSLCLVVLLVLPQVNSQCYFPNRTQNTNSDYQPCPPATQGLPSMCCATNRAANPDTCLPNGLCEGHGEIGAGFDTEAPYYRESCTDKSWNSTYCLTLCIGPGK